MDYLEEVLARAGDVTQKDFLAIRRSLTGDHGKDKKGRRIELVSIDYRDCEFEAFRHAQQRYYDVTLERGDEEIMLTVICVGVENVLVTIST